MEVLHAGYMWVKAHGENPTSQISSDCRIPDTDRNSAFFLKYCMVESFDLLP